MSSRELLWLDPARVHIRRTNEGLSVTADDQTVEGLAAKPAFPWSVEHGPIALVDCMGGTWAMIENCDELCPESRSAVQREVDANAFMPVILEVWSLSFHQNVFSFSTLTDRGPRDFKLSHTTWGRHLSEVTPRGELILRSVDGVRYRIPDPKALGERATKLLEVLM